jgi:hypothetical protein
VDIAALKEQTNFKKETWLFGFNRFNLHELKAECNKHDKMAASDSLVATSCLPGTGYRATGCNSS